MGITHCFTHLSSLHTALPAASRILDFLPELAAQSCSTSLSQDFSHCEISRLPISAPLWSAPSTSCSHQYIISTTKTGPHLLVKISMHLECLLAITVPAKVQATLYSCELLRWHSPCQGLQAQKASFIKELMCCSILLLLPAICTVLHCFTPKLLTLLRPSAAANTTTEVMPGAQRSSHITWSPVLQA